MNFEFSEDQKMIQEQARHFLSEQSPLTAARAVVEQQLRYDEKLWQAMLLIAHNAKDVRAVRRDSRELAKLRNLSRFRRMQDCLKLVGFWQNC